MPTHDDELPTLDSADLARVTGGAGDDLMAILPAFLAMRRNSEPAPAPAAVPPWKPKILVDGVEQQLTSTGNGALSTSTTRDL